MKRLPSIKTLTAVFDDQAGDARKILEMTHYELTLTDAGAARIKECYNPPEWYDVRLCVLDSLGKSFGVEGIQFNDGSWITYLNTGDTYSATLIYYKGKYIVTSWGDLVEYLERKHIYTAKERLFRFMIGRIRNG